MSETHEETLPTHWEEKEENVKYTIDVEINKEEPWLLNKIEMNIVEYHDGNYVSEVVIITLSEEGYHVEKYKTRFNWNGTGRDDILSLRFNDYADEPLRIFYYDEIAEYIDRYGVRETIEYVKGFVINAIAVSLTNKICELEEY